MQYPRRHHPAGLLTTTSLTLTLSNWGIMLELVNTRGESPPSVTHKTPAACLGRLASFNHMESETAVCFSYIVPITKRTRYPFSTHAHLGPPGRGDGRPNLYLISRHPSQVGFNFSRGLSKASRHRHYSSSTVSRALSGNAPRCPAFAFGLHRPNDPSSTTTCPARSHNQT